MLDYLLIGHVCMDLVPGGYTLGGTASFCGRLGELFGWKTGLLTSYGTDFLFEKELQNLEVVVKPAAATTIFDNHYRGNRRTQFLKAEATNLVPADLPTAWRAARWVDLAPIADEVRLFKKDHFSPTTRLVATPQGWFRRRHPTTHQVLRQSPDFQLFREMDIVILSEDDLPQVDLLKTLVELVPTVVVTRDERPAWLFTKGQQRIYPVIPTRVVDPTGAGDAFATGFLFQLDRGGSASAAMAFGHAVASVCLEGRGLGNLGEVGEIERRFRAYSTI